MGPPGTATRGVWLHWGALVALPLLGLGVLARLPEPVVNSLMFVELGRKWIWLERGLVVLVCVWIAAAILQRLLPKRPGSPANTFVALALTTFVFGAGTFFSHAPPLPRFERHTVALTPPAMPSEPIARCKHLIVCACPQGGQIQARDCEGETCEAACRKLAQSRADSGY